MNYWIGNTITTNIKAEKTSIRNNKKSAYIDIKDIKTLFELYVNGIECLPRIENQIITYKYLIYDIDINTNPHLFDEVKSVYPCTSHSSTQVLKNAGLLPSNDNYKFRFFVEMDNEITWNINSFSTINEVLEPIYDEYWNRAIEMIPSLGNTDYDHSFANNIYQTNFGLPQIKEGVQSYTTTINVEDYLKSLNISNKVNYGIKQSINDERGIEVIDKKHIDNLANLLKEDTTKVQVPQTPKALFTMLSNKSNNDEFLAQSERHYLPHYNVFVPKKIEVGHRGRTLDCIALRLVFNAKSYNKFILDNHLDMSLFNASNVVARMKTIMNNLVANPVEDPITYDVYSKVATYWLDDRFDDKFGSPIQYYYQRPTINEQEYAKHFFNDCMNMNLSKKDMKDNWQYDDRTFNHFYNKLVPNDYGMNHRVIDYENRKQRTSKYDFLADYSIGQFNLWCVNNDISKVVKSQLKKKYNIH